jgi:uncharacterized protein YoxC
MENTPVINIENHYHNHVDLSEIKLTQAEILSQINILKLKLHKMGQNTDKALEDLGAIKTQLTKIGTETSTLLDKIKVLEDAAANADTPQSVLDAIADVKAQAQVVDDEVPDAQP